MEPVTRVLLALDMTQPAEALALAETLAPYLDGFKVNYPLVLSGGLKMVTKLNGLAPVICDFKVADIPNTSRLIGEAAHRAGAQGLIVHGFVGPESLKACKAAFPGELYVVAQMSHPGAGRFFDPVALDIARMAREIGARGLIGPATRPEWVAKLKRAAPGLQLLSPGVGAQGGDPAAALRAGADFLIVGRSLYQAPDPVAAAQDLVARIAEAQEG